MNIRIIIHDNENMTLQVLYMLHEINQIEFKHKKKSLKNDNGTENLYRDTMSKG